MNIPNKTLRSGFSLPVYGLGTWQMGGRSEADYSNDKAEIAAIRNTIKHGITHIDTAESYGAGHCEELVAQAIKDYDRSNLLIATKVSGDHQSYDRLLRSFEASLKRLDTEYVDLYLLHRFPDAGINIKETMRALDRLISEGAVKNIGVCNFTTKRFENAQNHTSNKLVCNQVHYSLEVREAEKEGIVQYSQDNDIFLVAWGPLSKGTLQNPTMLNEIANKYGKTPYQVALNWLISQKNVVTIPKTTLREHLDENLGVLGWELSDEDINKLTKDFPNRQMVSDRFPLNY